VGVERSEIGFEALVGVADALVSPDKGDARAVMAIDEMIDELAHALAVIGDDAVQRLVLDARVDKRQGREGVEKEGEPLLGSRGRDRGQQDYPAIEGLGLGEGK
jgi:hypothetical protein